MTTVRRAVLDELLEVDEYDDPDSEPLESDDPKKRQRFFFLVFSLLTFVHLPESVELDRLLRLSLIDGLRDGIGDD